jgi:hypothetical protein
MPSNGTKKAKAVDVSAVSENGMLADEAVLPPNLTAEDRTKILSKLLELSQVNETDQEASTFKIQNEKKKLEIAENDKKAIESKIEKAIESNIKKAIESTVKTQSDNIKLLMLEINIEQIKLTLLALSESSSNLDDESKCINDAIAKFRQMRHCHQQPHQQQPPRQPTTVDFFQKIISGITADKAAIEKAVAEKVAAEEADKAEKADKAVAKAKVAAEEADKAEKADKAVAKAKVAAEKLAADKAVADKVAAKKAVAKAKANAEPKTMVEFTVGGKPGMWKQAKCMDKNPHDGNTCKFRHPSTDCPSFCSEQYDWTCNNADCDKNHIQPIIPPCRFGKTCNNKNCKFDH